jgi:5-methylcytosine-specific restriction enzyme subunit McrC
MTRLQAAEYQARTGWVRQAANEAGISLDDLRRLLDQASTRIAGVLESSEPPLWVDGDALEVRGFAGLVRLSRNVELEIAPKFLDSSDPTWREDFFYLANLSNRGRVLSKEELSSSGAARNDLASIVGRAFVVEFHRHARRPLREYRSISWSDWGLDGEADESELLTPAGDGFEQRGIALERRNIYNATIREAAVQLLPIVADPAVRLQLTRVRDLIGPQYPLRGVPRKRRLPSRHQRWEPLYELSFQVLQGLGMNLTPGQLNAPGYVVSTWQTWEALVRSAVHLCFPLHAQYHAKHVLGIRNGVSAVEVEPDLTVRIPGRPSVVVDAKYKGRLDRRSRVGEADLYEAMAFMRAAEAPLAILVYPLVSDQGTLPSTGATAIFDRIEVPDGTVLGASLDVRGISAKGGYRAVTDGLAALISVHSADLTVAGPTFSEGDSPGLLTPA